MLQKKISCYSLLLIIIIFSILITYGFSHYLFTRDVYYNSFQSQLDNIRIDELFDWSTQYAWIGLAFIPVWLIIKNFVVSLCLQTGLLLQNVKLKFGTTFKIALTAEFVFLLPQLIKLFWFLFIQKSYTITDVQQFYPLSALNMFDVKNLSPILVYPLQTFNVFEVMYWFVLAGGIIQYLRTDEDQALHTDKGIKIVLSGYIPALVLWIICIMFLTVSVSPVT